MTRTRRLLANEPAPEDLIEEWVAEWTEGPAQWSVAEVAACLGVKPRTVTAYLARGQMPPADGYVGRSPWWWESTIKGWRAFP